jgi:hypothetical protein
VDTSQCINCNKPIYYGPRVSARKDNEGGLERPEILWRHADTEDNKCSIRVFVATPIMNREETDRQ